MGGAATLDLGGLALSRHPPSRSGSNGSFKDESEGRRKMAVAVEALVRAAGGDEKA
jgi:hypothetical protein